MEHWRGARGESKGRVAQGSVGFDDQGKRSEGSLSGTDKKKKKKKKKKKNPTNPQKPLNPKPQQKNTPRKKTKKTPPPHKNSNPQKTTPQPKKHLSPSFRVGCCILFWLYARLKDKIFLFAVDGYPLRYEIYTELKPQAKGISWHLRQPLTGKEKRGQLSNHEET